MSDGQRYIRLEPAEAEWNAWPEQNTKRWQVSICPEFTEGKWKPEKRSGRDKKDGADAPPDEGSVS